jgi:ubiquinone/menaquinone biosynthesis C-methylase UbiE
VTFPVAETVGPSGAVVATDISDRMVDVVRREAARRGVAHVRAARMDAETLDLEDSSCNAALCGLGLMYVPDPIRALREMRRVLVPGGRVAAAVWGRRDRCGWAEIFPIVDRRVESEVCPLFFQLGTGDALRYAMEQADLEGVTVERLSTVLQYASLDDAIGAAFAGGPVALAYSRFDDQTREDAHAEYAHSIAAYRRGTGYEIPGEFVVALAWRPTSRT